MSRRYGRQQKRKAREQIAQLEFANRQLQAGFEVASRRVTELRESLKQITDVLGPNFIGLPPKQLAMRVENSFRLFTDAGPERMHLVEIAMRTASNEHPQKQLHCHVILANGQSAYALSEAALLQLSEDQLINRIAPEIAQHLVREVRKNPLFNRR